MRMLFQGPTRLAAMTALLAGAFLLLPVNTDPLSPLGYAIASAAGNGGDHGGMRDQVQQGSNSGASSYTSYSAAPMTAPVTPCQSCYGGSGTDAQNLGTYNYGMPNDCKSCENGETGK
jgi:hypothetical protein